MGRFLQQYDKDYMKMAMLKQEETFRQQVHELHRLYRVQKLLMNDMKSELKSRQRKTSSISWNRENEIRSIQAAADLELPAQENTRKGDDDDEEEEENDLELTLATGSRNIRKKKKENNSSFTADSGVSLSSTTSAESGSEKLNGNEWGLFQMRDVKLVSYDQSERKSSRVVSEGMREERMKQSPWLFQCLSLKMT